MKFAFLIHPICKESAAFLELDIDGALQASWGTDPLGVCAHLHEAIEETKRREHTAIPTEPRVVDELNGLVCGLGNTAEGRLYEIPMDALSILSDPDRALRYMEEAVEMAVEWGAEIIGLGSMTGIVGGRGTYLAERSTAAITTGNSLTVYAALQNLYHVVEELDIDLSRETVAVIGVPGSIASAVAQLIAPHCGNLLLVGRNSSAPSRKLADELGVELLLDIPQALDSARIVISATSSGSCIDQSLLKPGTVVIDVGVPTDVQGTEAARDDILVLTGGLTRVPETMSCNSKLLWFQHGMIPSCLGETMVLALEGRAESLSLGRCLDLDTIQEIGSIAKSHGFDFSKFTSFGHPLEESALVRFHKARTALRLDRTRRVTTAPTPQQLAERAPALHARHINPVLLAMGGPSNFVKTFVKGDGVHLYDAEGNRYLDLIAGFGSVNLGHNHPAVANAVGEALRSQAPGFAPSAVNPFAAALAEEVISVAPSKLEMVFFCNSGTEAIEASLKLSRITTGRTGLLHCDGSFHGKSMGSLSVTSNLEYRRPFGPLVPGCESVPFGDFNALDRALSTRRFAAFVVEPIQAEGGMHVPPAGYLREAQALCRATGTLLVVDEIQTGLGRTGAMFAVDNEGVEPDVMTLAKSLGGGMMPIGAMLTRRDLWHQAYGNIQKFALHTSTFSGGSLACAAGIAALRALRDEGLSANAHARGAQLHRGLVEMCQRYRCLKEVRGKGLLLGLEFQPLPDHICAHWKAIDQTGMMRYMVPGMDDVIRTFHVLHAMQTLLQAHGVYTQVARSNPLVMRIQPPLTITEEQVDQVLSAFDQTCAEVDYSTKLIDGMIAKSGIGQHDASLRNNGSPVHGKPHA